MAAATVASAQNVLENPGFEEGPKGGGAGPGWITFGNVFTEGPDYPFVPYEGNQLVSMFGNFTGGFNVTGIFQAFPTYPGAEWRMSSKALHVIVDPMIGEKFSGNWVVQKIAFKDANNNEIGFAESVILDGTYETEVWHDSDVIVGIAPPGTVALEAFILYLQPLFDGGAAHIDNVELIHVMDIDVKPQSCPNPLNVRNKGMLPVAILGSAGLDVNMIDVSSLTLQGIAPMNWSIEDVSTPVPGDCGCTPDGGDGYMDLVLKFPAHMVGQTLMPAYFGDEKQVTLMGSMMNGIPFVGTDCVVLKGAPKDKVAPEPGGEGQSDTLPIGPLSLSVINQGPQQKIEYVLPEPTDVNLTVYDVRGRVVERLVQWAEGAGTHTVEWNPSGHPSGVYFFRLEAVGRTVTQKAVVVRR